MIFVYTITNTPSFVFMYFSIFKEQNFSPEFGADAIVTKDLITRDDKRRSF